MYVSRGSQGSTYLVHWGYLLQITPDTSYQGVPATICEILATCSHEFTLTPTLLIKYLMFLVSILSFPEIFIIFCS